MYQGGIEKAVLDKFLSHFAAWNLFSFGALPSQYFWQYGADLTQCKFLLHWTVHMQYKSYTRVSCSTYTHKIQPWRIQPIGPIASESIDDLTYQAYHNAFFLSKFDSTLKNLYFKHIIYDCMYTITYLMRGSRVEYRLFFHICGRVAELYILKIKWGLTDDTQKK